MISEAVPLVIAVTGHRDLVASEVAVGAQRTIDEFSEFGAAEFLVVADTLGVGDPPASEPVLLPSEPRHESIMAGIRSFLARIQDPPSEVQRAVDRAPWIGDTIAPGSLARAASLSARTSISCTAAVPAPAGQTASASISRGDSRSVVTQMFGASMGAG